MSLDTVTDMMVESNNHQGTTTAIIHPSGSTNLLIGGSHIASLSNMDTSHLGVQHDNHQPKQPMINFPATHQMVNTTNKLPPVSSLSNSSYNSTTAQLSLPNLLQMPNTQIMHQPSHQPSMRSQGQTTVLGLLNASSHHGQSLSQAHQIQRITGTNMSGNSMLMVQQLQQINDQSQPIRMAQPTQQHQSQHQTQQHSLCMQQNFLQQLHNALNNNQTKPLQPVSHFQIQLPTQQPQQHIPQQITSLPNNVMGSGPPLTMTTMTTVNPTQISQLQQHMMAAKRMANGEIKSVKNTDYS
ncbi:uncharacterized protein [Antedon mediterranea]|uniref:uncharacterized protein n=1 Tax=Antedon mediterranea TaxID=105859 RepID=UPI003AF91FA5